MSSLIIGLDLGTTGCKALAVDEAANVCASARASYPLKTPAPGAAEQNASEVCQQAVRTLKHLVRQIKRSGRFTDIVGLSLSGAMHTLLPVDADHQPLAGATIWADSRAASTCASLRQQLDLDAHYRETGCPFQPLYHPARLAWHRDAQPDLFTHATRWVAIKDFLLHHLTGQWKTDTSLASATGLLNLHTASWRAESLQTAGISEQQLPQLIEPDAIAGRLTEPAARQTSLPADLPVYAGASDGALSNYGALAGPHNDLVINVGTSAAVRRFTSQPHFDSQQRTWTYLLKRERFLVGGAINNAGLVLHWLCLALYDRQPTDAALDTLIQDAARIPPGSDGLIMLPYLTGERSPHFSADAAASFHDARLNHTRPHFTRAALESVACCLADVLAALPPALDPDTADARTAPRAHLTGGITRNPLWMQILSDVLGLHLIPNEAPDASALGAALLAHHAANPPAQTAPQRDHNAPIITPDPAHAAVYRTQYARFRELYQRLHAPGQPAH